MAKELVLVIGSRSMPRAVFPIPTSFPKDYVVVPVGIKGQEYLKDFYVKVYVYFNVKVCKILLAFNPHF